jgi:phosphotransferase family enzyme
LNLDDALSGRAKLEGVQWLLLSAGPRRVLRDQLKSLLSEQSVLGPCRLRRAKFKPGHKLTAYYDALVRMAGSAAFRTRPVAVTWAADNEAARRQAEHDVAKMQAEARRHGVAAPFRRLTADLMPWSMHISVSPLDTRFLHLVCLMDPRYVRGMLTAACPMRDPASARSHAVAYTVTAIRYRPGQRHVLRYDRLDGSNGTVFAKLYTGEDGERVFHVAIQAAEWLAQHAEGVTAVRPFAYAAEHKALLYPGLSGAPLTGTLRRRGRGLARWLERAGTALRALHLLPPSIAGPLPAHDFAAEVRETTRATAHIPVLLPSAGAAICALLDRARELHDRLPQEPPTFTHGDFKSEHVWCGPGGLTLLDFDSCHRGDPALDIGKFLAHLQLWHVLNAQAGLEPAQERFLAGYAGGIPERRLARARLYEAVELIKITGRRVPLFDPEWVSRTERLIGRAHAVMNDLELCPPAGRSPFILGKEHAARA